MKLTPISIEDVTENLYTDYWMDCTDEGETPLQKSEWIKLEGVKLDLLIYSVHQDLLVV